MSQKRDVRDDQCYDILNDIIRIMSNPRSSDDQGDRRQSNGDSNLKHARGTAAKDDKKQKSSDEEEEDDG